MFKNYCCIFKYRRRNQLIIGVRETKGRKNKILGIENELGFSDIDAYERHFVQQIINRIGKKFASNFIKTKFIDDNLKKILHVNIKKYNPKKGEIPTFLDKIDIYISTGPRTDLIREGENLESILPKDNSNFNYYQLSIFLIS